MTSLWSNPEFWNGIGVVGIVVLVGAALFLALARRWLVPGWFHREVVAMKDAIIESKDARAAKDADTIATLSHAVTVQNANDTATTRILTAVRDLAANGGGK